MIGDCWITARDPETEDKMKIEIRPFQPEDEAAVIRLWTDCGLVVPWNNPARDMARKRRVQPELFLLGWKDGALVATVMAGYDGHRGWLNYLAVDPAYRRGGVGRFLVAEAEARLGAMGCPKINLQVRSANSEVIEFYKKIGFVEDDVVSLGRRLEPDG